MAGTDETLRDAAPVEPARQTVRTQSNPEPPVAYTDGTGELGLLMEVTGANAGRVHRLGSGDDLISIGRDAKSRIAFDDATLSRQHAWILCQGGQWFIEDSGSHNGTWVNRERVTRVRLEHGDRIRLGNSVQLLFHRVTPAEEEMLIHLYEAGVRDGLTGVFNRRYLAERLDEEVGYATRHDTDLGLVMIDLDRFKDVNDRHGHLASDEVLRHVARMVRKQLRPEDVLCRYGGEEFVVMTRDPGPGALATFAERIRAVVESTPTRFEGAELPITISCGGALLSRVEPRTPNDLVAAADAAMYRAKEAGRNRVEMA
jgi:diguanylate cyclase (GGDEF)-like protein